MPPTVTAVCAPNTSEFAWQVSTNETLGNYNVDVSLNAGATFPVEETGATQRYTFYTQRPGGTGSSNGQVVIGRWHDDPEVGATNGANSDPYPCVTPVLLITTDCAYAGSLPDGGAFFAGGVQGMVFDVYGPETHGSFPSDEAITTADDGTGGDGSFAAGSYEYAYVVPGGTPTIDGVFSIGVCPRSTAG